jgi:hypothetical protein
LEGSGNILISGNILSFAGANGENHKKKIQRYAVQTGTGKIAIGKKSATRMRGTSD